MEMLNKMGNATENFGIYLTLPERWRKKLEAEAAIYSAPSKQIKIQNAILAAIAASYFPEECEVTKQ